MALQTDRFNVTVYFVHNEMPEQLANSGLIQFIVEAGGVPDRLTIYHRLNIWYQPNIINLVTRR